MLAAKKTACDIFGDVPSEHAIKAASAVLSVHEKGHTIRTSAWAIWELAEAGGLIVHPRSNLDVVWEEVGTTISYVDDPRPRFQDGRLIPDGPVPLNDHEPAEWRLVQLEPNHSILDKIFQQLSDELPNQDSSAAAAAAVPPGINKDIEEIERQTPILDPASSEWLSPAEGKGVRTIYLIVLTPFSCGLLYLLYDGHGSTRGLVDATGEPLTDQIYAYDAFGNRLMGSGLVVGTPLTTLLYSGEQSDLVTGLQYLRARFYDPRTGRFNRLDPFAGNLEDPQSLHKYLYVHADPINGIDPRGLFFGGGGLTGLLSSISIGASIGSLSGSAAFAALGANPAGILNGAFAGFQAGVGFAIAPNKFDAFLGGIIGAGVEVAVTFGETLLGYDDPFKSYDTFGEFAQRTLTAFAEGVFYTAIEQLRPTSLSNNNVLFVQAITPLIRGLVDIGAQEINSPGSQNLRDVLTTLFASTIDQSFNLITSEVHGLPSNVRGRISRFLIRSQKLTGYPLILWGPGAGGKLARAEFSYSIAKRLVDVALPTLNRVIHSFTV